ncbi:MICOS complex subunit MIC25 isoform X2 [Petaurus breviceps papuanus]|uniref:MICOS complex subunit MIC25 isoform X2 n=1 Tax=Petaurus breviceps papuanus TaxID=3040969 RepID=UPI0036DDFD4E
MGSTESTPRKVSFGVDEEERVRVLQGIRLSEDVVNRMKDPSASSRVQQPSPASPPPASTSTSPPAASALHISPPPPSFSHSSSFAFGSPEDPKPPKAESQSSRQPSEAEEDLYRRYEQEQAMIQEELLQLVKREREVTRDHTKSSLSWENDMNQEKQRTAQLAKELEGVEAELRRRDIFYKEQLGRIERKNAEMYRLSSQQFHEAATRLEDTVKPRRAEPVCSGLQSEILRCYRDNLREVLKCSDLVKAYQHCVSTAQKNLTTGLPTSSQRHKRIEPRSHSKLGGKLVLGSRSASFLIQGSFYYPLLFCDFTFLFSPQLYVKTIFNFLVFEFEILFPSPLLEKASNLIYMLYVYIYYPLLRFMEGAEVFGAEFRAMPSPSFFVISSSHQGILCGGPLGRYGHRTEKKRWGG